MNLMKGKRGVVCGVLSDRSIAWGIAKALYNNGAEVALTYQNDTARKRVAPLAKSLESQIVIECDASSAKSIDEAFGQLSENWETIDFFVHAIAFSDKNELNGRYIDTSGENFKNAMNISAYSFSYMGKKASELMKNGGSMLTLSYYGAEKVIPNYNVMGLCKAALEASVRYMAFDLGKDNIRVNALSPGPVKTLAASGISDFNELLQWNVDQAPISRAVTIEEVGNSALFLLSDLSTAITGSVIHVDNGYNVTGMRMR